ncbi:MAG: ABC transporter, permease protein 1 (cluster 1, maltose/g3p/polyamine/iron), partial [uncultured Nocardioidaceae bacterium]
GRGHGRGGRCRRADSFTRRRQRRDARPAVDRLAVPGAVPRAVPDIRAGPDHLRLVDQPAQLGLHAADQAVRRVGQLPGSTQPRLRVVRGVLELDAGHRHLHAVQRAAPAHHSAGHRRLDEPDVSRAQRRASDLLRPVRAGGRRHRPAVAVPSRRQHRSGELLHRTGRARHHPLAELDPGGVDSTGGGDRVVDPWVQLGHLPGGLARHPSGAVRGGQGRRCEWVAHLLARDAAGPQACHLVRHHDHDHRLGQHVRTVIPDDERRSRPGDPDRDLPDRRDGSAELPDGCGRRGELDPDPAAHRRLGRRLRAVPRARSRAGM